MRGQEYRDAITHFGWEVPKSLLHTLSQGLQEEGLEMPISGNLELEFKACNGILQCADVATHNDRRVLRRHNHANQLICASSDFRHNISNKWRCETHASHDTEGWAARMLAIQFLLERSRLLTRDAQQRRAAYQFIAASELSD